MSTLDGDALGTEIVAALDSLPQGRTPTQADWTRLSRGIRASLDARIATLERARARLDGCIGCGCLSLKKCALFNPDDRIGRNGPGPRFVLTAEAVEDAAC